MSEVEGMSGALSNSGLVRRLRLPWQGGGNILDSRVGRREYKFMHVTVWVPLRPFARDLTWNSRRHGMRIWENAPLFTWEKHKIFWTSPTIITSLRVEKKRGVILKVAQNGGRQSNKIRYDHCIKSPSYKCLIIVFKARWSQKLLWIKIVILADKECSEIDLVFNSPRFWQNVWMSCKWPLS